MDSSNQVFWAGSLSFVGSHTRNTNLKDGKHVVIKDGFV